MNVGKGLLQRFLSLMAVDAFDGCVDSKQNPNRRKAVDLRQLNLNGERHLAFGGCGGHVHDLRVGSCANSQKESNTIEGWGLPLPPDVAMWRPSFHR